MADHPDAAVYREYVERFLRGDIDAVAPLLADGVVWNEPGGAAAISDKQAVLEQMRWVTSALDVEIDVHDVVANDRHVVALTQFHLAAADRTLASRSVEIWHVRDQQVTERWVFVDDIAEFMDFFANLARG